MGPTRLPPDSRKHPCMGKGASVSSGAQWGAVKIPSVVRRPTIVDSARRSADHRAWRSTDPDP